MDLREALERNTVDELKRMLAVLPCAKCTPLPKRKGELINRLIAIFSSKESVSQCIDALDMLSRRVLAEAAYADDGYLDTHMIQAKYGTLPKLTKESDRHFGWNQDKTLLGTFFADYCLPRDVQPIIKSLLSKPSPFCIQASQAIPVDLKQHRSEHVAIHELHALLALFSNDKLKVTDKTKSPTGHTIKAIDHVLVHGDFYSAEDQKACRAWEPKVAAIRAFAWTYLLRAAKLIKIVGCRIEVTTKGKKAHQSAPAEVLKSLWDAWVQTNILDEFSRISIIKGQKRAKKLFTAPHSRRTVIETVLTHLTPHEWFRVDDISDYMRANQYYFNVVSADPWQLYIVDSEHGSLGYDGYHGWHLMQLRYMLCVLFEYAATLGLIDIAYASPIHARKDYDQWGTDDFRFLSQYDGLHAIKINALGAYVLGINDHYQPDSIKLDININTHGIVHIDADYIPVDLAIVLQHYAVSQGDHQWQFSKASLSTGYETQGNFTALHNSCEQYDLHLPTAIKNSIREIEQNSKKVRFKERFFMFECQTEAVADQLLQINAIKKYAVKAGQNLLAIPEKKQAVFIAALKQQGIILNV